MSKNNERVLELASQMEALCSGKPSKALTVIDYLSAAADLLDDAELYVEAEVVTRLIEKYAKEKPKDDFIFPSTHPKVKSGDHFPINTENRARNALAQVNKFDKAPDWWKGSVKELVNTVTKAVKKKYPDIEVSKAAKKPGKG